MLRLRPSELTLTLDDVEDTFRRIAQRRAQRLSPVVSTQPDGRQGRPTLRRGPQRSIRDAITSLDNVPLLLPQQAISTSIDEESENELEQHASPSRTRADSVAGAASSAHNTQVISTAVTSPATVSTMDLPFRPAHTQQPRTVPSNATHIPAANNLDHIQSRPQSFVTSTDSTNGPSPTHAAVASESPPELRGGGHTERGCSRSNAIDTFHVPSPLHRMHKLSSPRKQTSPGDPVKTSGSVGVDPALSHLQECLKDFHLRSIKTASDAKSNCPQTEPRRGRGHHMTMMRSLSSGSIPSFNLRFQRPITLDHLADNAFGNPAAPKPPMAGTADRRRASSSAASICHSSKDSFVAEEMNVKSREFSSSDASAAFSYYGSLPSGSRQSSSEQFGDHPVGPIPYSDSADSTQRDDLSATANTMLKAVNPKRSSARYLSASVDTYSVSPLPLLPQIRSASPLSGSATAISADEGHLDAATAAVRNLGSPLDDYSEQYERFIRTEHARRTIPARPSSTSRRVEVAESSRSDQASIRRHADTTHNLRMARAMALRRQQLRSVHRPVEHLPDAMTHHTHGRNSQLTRNNQRSSENMPVNPISSDGRTTRESQVQIHRAAFERMHGAVQAMQAVHARSAETRRNRSSAPQTDVPRDVSNQNHAQAPIQLVTRNFSPHGSEGTTSDMLGSTPTSGPTNSSPLEAASTLIPWRSSQQHIGDISQRGQTHAYTQRPTAPRSYLHLRTTRDSPLTSVVLDHGSGTTSRRSRSPLVRAATSVRTHRRMPAHQLDQENSAEVEMMPARQEQTAINARYNEDEQRDVMDDTPPRVGRYEQHMLGR